jgi:hypothetical protein
MSASFCAIQLSPHLPTKRAKLKVSLCGCFPLQARSTKAKARVDAYGVLVEKARDNPTADLRVDFGRVGMARLGE